jgi:anaerobic magnesium-protoporphyrin IX monomethyl ester cyclase
VRVSIVHPYFEIGELRREEPLGAEYLASVLEAQGHQVQIVDGFGFNLDEAGLYERVTGFAPHLLAISLPMSPQFPDGMALARHVRATHPEVSICFGGNYPTFAYRTLIQEPCVDYIVLHEGERSFAALVGTLEDGRDPALVEGVVTPDKVLQSQNGISPAPLVEDLDGLPFPARHLTPEHTQVYDIVTLITSRGCPFACANCSTTAMWQHRRRARSVDNVIAEIEMLVDTYPRRTLGIVDDLFTANRRWMHNFCDRYAPIWERHHVAWTCNTRVDTLDETLLARMGAVGCRLVFLGVESGSARVLEEIGKRYDADHVLHLLRVCAANGIQPNVALMMGLPYETQADLEATINLARCVVQEVPSATANVRPVTPILGTPLYDEADRYGVVIEKDDQFHLDLKEPRISTRYLSRRDLAAALLACKIVLRGAGRDQPVVLPPANSPPLRGD